MPRATLEHSGGFAGTGTNGPGERTLGPFGLRCRTGGLSSTPRAARSIGHTNLGEEARPQTRQRPPGRTYRGALSCVPREPQATTGRGDGAGRRGTRGAAASVPTPSRLVRTALSSLMPDAPRVPAGPIPRLDHPAEQGAQPRPWAPLRCGLRGSWWGLEHRGDVCARGGRVRSAASGHGCPGGAGGLPFGRLDVQACG